MKENKLDKDGRPLLRGLEKVRPTMGELFYCFSEFM